MKTIELTQEQGSEPNEQSLTKQRPIVLTVGDRPVAALLPMVDQIADLAEFDHLINEEETVQLTVRGKPIALLQTLIPMVVLQDDIDLETIALSTNLRFLELIKESKTRHQHEGGISAADMRTRLGL